MFKRETRFVATITDVHRLSNTINGNPRYRVHFADGAVSTTKADANIASMITNSEYREGPVTVIVDSNGFIVGVEK